MMDISLVSIALAIAVKNAILACSVRFRLKTALGNGSAMEMDLGEEWSSGDFTNKVSSLGA